MATSAPQQLARAIAALGAIASVLVVSPSARSDALRLRGDAMVQTRSPVGLLMLRGEDRVRPWVDVEAVAWLGARESVDATGDVQTLTIRLRDPHGLGEVRAGRFVFTAGAIRPLHLDGVRALGRAPFGGTLEVFAGSAVAPRFGNRMFDYAVGGRAGQAFGTSAILGLSYVMRRRGGQLADEEIGADTALSPTRWLDVAGRIGIDLASRGPADALASIGAHNKETRLEGFLTYRSAARILPSTSLFSVLGDIPATTSGATLRHRIAPRLDLMGTGGAIFQGSELGGYFTGRANLALDDDWAGNIGVEVRRQYLDKARWVGVRALLGLPLGASFRFATELELVRPDDQKGGTRLWPWALAAIAYRAPKGWDFAAGVEALRTRDDRNELHALLRVTYNFERMK